jgi:hypothetical protein
MSGPELPPPLMPSEVDLTGLTWMPLEVSKVMQSSLFIKSTGDEFKAAFALWCASWYETPAGSLPNDEEMLEDLSRSKRWSKVRAMAMKGWVLCSDGRLYHETVVRNAIAAWDRRVDHRESVDNKTTRQARWRARLKEVAGQLRELGVTPPAGASLETLETLLRDARPSTVDAHVDATGDGQVDKPETGKTGQGRTGEDKTKERDPSGSVGSADPPAKGKPPKVPPCPYDEIVKAFEEILPELPSVRLGISDKRKRAFAKFWTWIFESTKRDGTRRATDKASGLAWIRDYFNRARDNDFVMGRTPRGKGHENWVCDIDFLLSENGLKQVIEKTQAIA